jgi:RecJ-like exonuclease
MQVKCPICGKDGTLQQRYNHCRIGHYKGFKKTARGHTTIVEWHNATIQDILLVNKEQIYLNEDGKITLFTDKKVNNGENNEKDHCLQNPQIMSLAPKPG